MLNNKIVNLCNLLFINNLQENSPILKRFKM